MHWVMLRHLCRLLARGLCGLARPCPSELRSHLARHPMHGVRAGLTALYLYVEIRCALRGGFRPQADIFDLVHALLAVVAPQPPMGGSCLQALLRLLLTELEPAAASGDPAAVWARNRLALGLAAWDGWTASELRSLYPILVPLRATSRLLPALAREPRIPARLLAATVSAVLTEPDALRAAAGEPGLYRTLEISRMIGFRATDPETRVLAFRRMPWPHLQRLAPDAARLPTDSWALLRGLQERLRTERHAAGCAERILQDFVGHAWERPNELQAALALPLALPPDSLRRLLTHPSPRVRRQALRRTGRRDPEYPPASRRITVPRSSGFSSGLLAG